MSILLSVLAVAFAAFCIWLTVRIVNRREPMMIVVAVLTGLVSLVVAAIAYLAWLGREC